jgi:hypothetical protein
MPVCALRIGKAWLFYYLAWRRADGPGRYPQACSVWRKRAMPLFWIAMQLQLDMRNFDVYNSASFP